MPDDFLAIWDAVNEALTDDHVASQRVGRALRSEMIPTSVMEADL